MSQTVEAREHARQQARAHLESIVELVEAIETAQINQEADFEGDTLDLEELEERAREWPLSILVRSDWVSPGSEMVAAEYELLLCTGGPAVRIRGDLSEYQQPINAHLEHQDWFTPWDRASLSSGESDALLRFASLFWFGE
ncbi:hypothetical protein ACFLS5_03570 [Candidatus Bipolaricaulota bacterium]